MFRKTFAVFALMVFALGVISSTYAQDTKLVIWADDTRAPLLAALADQVQADLGITLDVVTVGLGDARDQLLTAGPVGEGPDVLILPHDQLGQVIANGAIVPIELDDATKANFTEAGLAAWTLNGQLWGIPYAQENVALIRNVDIVPDAYKTWDDVRATGEALKADGIFPLVIPTGDTYHNFPVTSAFGGYIFGFNDDGSYNVSDIGLATEGGLAAAEWLSGMYKDGLLPTDATGDVMMSLWNDGKTGAIITGPWNSQAIIDSGINYAIDPFPGVEGVSENGAPFSGVQGFAISAFGQNQLLAETFLLDYVATPEFMQAVFEAGRRAPTFLGVDTSSDPNQAGFAAAGANAVPMPAIPEMGSVWGAAGNALTLISTGEDPITTEETAVAQIKESIQLAASGAVKSVTLVGDLQSEAGCAGDWDPTCETTFMNDLGEGKYDFVVTLPAGEYQYKVAINGDWAENYGKDGKDNGDNIALSLAAETEVTFTFDYNTKTITDSVNN